MECAGLNAKDARLNFSHQPLLLGNHWSTKGGFLDIMYLLHRTEIQHRFCFFHSCLDGYLDSDIFQHTKHPNMDLYKAKVVLIVLTKQTLPLICAHEVPCAEDEDYVFCCELVFFIFSLLHSTFLPSFCSQSSISQNCIWNNRSSYHSLKRLVCPALCILAVLSNPLV